MKRMLLALAMVAAMGVAASPGEAQAGFRRPVLGNAARGVGRAAVLFAWNRLYYSQMYIPRPPSYFGYRY